MHSTALPTTSPPPSNNSAGKDCSANVSPAIKILPLKNI